MLDNIVVKGAKENNLKNVDVVIPKNKLVVFSGVSGCGKSTLAFDTIFAEGQRRYIESLSSYARQFLGELNKPDVESITGLSPSISIDQKSTNNNPRSTVGTITEIYDYIRLLYARIGIPHCPNCHKIIDTQTIDQIVDSVMELNENTKIWVNAPVVRDRKGSFEKLFYDLKKDGYIRVKVDGEELLLEDQINLDKNKKHNIFVVVDRIVVKSGIEKRLTESIEKCLELAEGIVVISTESEDKLYSIKYACSDCGISIPDLQPNLFSFNNHMGACPKCGGLGYVIKIGESAIVKNDNLTLNEGAMTASGWNNDYTGIGHKVLEKLAKKFNFSLNVPYKNLPEEIRKIIMYGEQEFVYTKNYNFNSYLYDSSNLFEGVIPYLLRKFNETTSDYVKEEIFKLMSESTCPVCNGKRLNEVALSVTVGNVNIFEMTELSVEKLYAFLKNLKLNKNHAIIAEPILTEIFARLEFLQNVGLKYLSLSRKSGTLSGGESQRIRLATQIGSGLTGVVYILDEPSIGLHQKDNERLISTLKNLRDMGNTLIVVEHDEDTIRSADHIIDIGPLAGVHGGEIVAQGSVQDLINSKKSITGKYLSGEYKIEIPSDRRVTQQGFISIKKAHKHNLKNIDVNIPKGVFTCITGVSGSGKSTLINDILYPAITSFIKKENDDFDANVLNLEDVDNCISIDQSPIGRTPRSNPATYTGLFTKIRELFASTNDAKERGFDIGRFSFNVKGGRCEACQGDGVKKIKMFFLPDLYVPCEVCKGKRYNREVLQVKYKNKNIYDILEMTVEEALEFFKNITTIKSRLQTLYDVGLGYIKLGQPAPTLSGGEAQRLKLASELQKRNTGKTIYILDEPTTGLHSYDIQKLVTILQRFVSGGNTVIVIEHNLDIIKCADYIIDLGPEGGDEGGYVVATGTPEEIAKVKNSYTGQYLKRILK